MVLDELFLGVGCHRRFFLRGKEGLEYDVSGIEHQVFFSTLDMLLLRARIVYRLVTSVRGVDLIKRHLIVVCIVVDDLSDPLRSKVLLIRLGTILRPFYPIL